MDVAYTVFKFRLENNLTRKNMAELMGVTTTAVAYYESCDGCKRKRTAEKVLSFIQSYKPRNKKKHDYSENVRRFREKHNISRKELCKALGLHQTTIDFWESGKCKWNEKAVKNAINTMKIYRAKELV